MWKVALPDITTGTYHDARNSGLAILPHKGNQFDMSVKREAANVVSCMPTFAELKQELKRSAKVIGNSKRDDVDLHLRCLSTLYDVNRVPLSLQIKARNDPLRLRLQLGKAQQSDIIPIGIRKFDIGSNVGLVQFWKAYYLEHIKPSVNKQLYRMVTCDVNIYWRSMKVRI